MSKNPKNNPSRPQSWVDALVVVPPILSVPDKPLSLGIHEAINAIRKDDVSKASIRVLLMAHTRTKEYHEAIKKGGERFSLSGEPDGTVEPSHQARAEGYLNG